MDSEKLRTLQELEARLAEHKERADEVASALLAAANALRDTTRHMDKVFGKISLLGAALLADDPKAMAQFNAMQILPALDFLIRRVIFLKNV